MVTATHRLRAIEYNTMCNTGRGDIKLTASESRQSKKKSPGCVRIVSDCCFLFVHCLSKNSQQIILIRQVIDNVVGKQYT